MLQSVVDPSDLEAVEELMNEISSYMILKRSTKLGINTNLNLSFERVLVFCDLGAYLD